MVTCFLHSLPPLASLPHRPLATLTASSKSEIVHDEKKGQRRFLFSKAAMLVALTSFMDTMVTILWYEKEIIHPHGRNRAPLPPSAVAPVRYRGDGAHTAAYAVTVDVAIATKPAALQQAPRWSLTHTYVRDMRVNPSELRMLAAEYSMMHDTKITRPLRNRHSLKQRHDNFVWGRQSPLRITSNL
ncbi:hypothetical protein BX666DRAFT_2003462 [Dichotomocladium elegans]|nr:hypothetical protein BX666DRAFT_2003462 [Dichotomocladium elegans]